MLVLAVWLIGAFVCAVIGAALAASKGHGVAGFVLGFLFGPVGIVIALLLPSENSSAVDQEQSGNRVLAKRVPCPFCAEEIQPTAIKCRFCASELPPEFQQRNSATTVLADSTNALDFRPSQERIQQLRSTVESDAATFETYEELIRGFGGRIVSKGFLFGQHYEVDLEGTRSRIESFEDLRPWILAKVKEFSGEPMK